MDTVTVTVKSKEDNSRVEPDSKFQNQDRNRINKLLEPEIPAGYLKTQNPEFGRKFGK